MLLGLVESAHLHCEERVLLLDLDIFITDRKVMLGGFLDFVILKKRISSGPRASKNVVGLLEEMGWKGESRGRSLEQLATELSEQVEHVSRQRGMNRTEALADYVLYSEALPTREKYHIFGHVES